MVTIASVAQRSPCNRYLLPFAFDIPGVVDARAFVAATRTPLPLAGVGVAAVGPRNLGT